jgi:hypothetical protein
VIEESTKKGSQREWKIETEKARKEGVWKVVMSTRRTTKRHCFKLPVLVTVSQDLNVKKELNWINDRYSREEEWGEELNVNWREMGSLWRPYLARCRTCLKFASFFLTELPEFTPFDGGISTPFDVIKKSDTLKIGWMCDKRSLNSFHSNCDRERSIESPINHLSN